MTEALLLENVPRHVPAQLADAGTTI